MKNLPKILLFVAVFVGVFLFARNCNNGCSRPDTDQTTTDTVTTQIPGIVETETPSPTIEKPLVDSSVFKQLAKFQTLWRNQMHKNEDLAKYLIAVQDALNDSTLNLQSRYDILQRAFEVQKERAGIVFQYAQDLERKLEETANGDYVTQGKDSTDAYTLDWSINSFAPLKENGFKRTVNVTQREITKETTVTKYRNSFSVAALYGFTPDDLQIYSVQLGKDWKRVGIISQFGLTNDKQPVFSGGLKINFSK